MVIVLMSDFSILDWFIAHSKRKPVDIENFNLVSKK